MADPLETIKRVKLKIKINAPSEVCYQSWSMGFIQFPTFMRRVASMLQEVKPIETRIETHNGKASHRSSKMLPTQLVNHWLFYGPKGRIYEVNNKTTLDIPNLFHSTTSVDPEDISIQSSVSFLPDANNQTTLLEWQVSFLDSQILKKGKSTRLISDILTTGDGLLMDCLRDFKKAVEASYQRPYGSPQAGKKPFPTHYQIPEAKPTSPREKLEKPWQ